MADPVELWKQQKIEALAPGESWIEEWSFTVHRYKDGWHFYWKQLTRGSGWCSDLGRFFDEDHIWDMRNFMSGKWEKRGIPIIPPKRDDLL